MKVRIYHFLFVFIVGLAFAECKNEPAVDETAPEVDPIISDALAVTAGEYPVITGPDGLISPQTRSLMEGLIADFWYVEQWVEMNQGKRDIDAAKANRGRWFQFSKDGALKTGKLQSDGPSGRWEYDPQKAQIVLDMDGADDLEFNLKITPDRKVMLWVGTERFNQNNIQLKLENYVEQMAEMPIPGN